MLKTVVAILISRYTECVMGCFMAFSACYEIYESIQSSSHSLGSHHGIALFGSLTALKALFELLRGARMVAKGQSKSLKEATKKPK